MKKSLMLLSLLVDVVTSVAYADDAAIKKSVR